MTETSNEWASKASSLARWVGASQTAGACVVEEATVTAEANDAVKENSRLGGRGLERVTVSHAHSIRAALGGRQQGESVGGLRVSRNGFRLDLVDVVPQIRELFEQ